MLVLLSSKLITFMMKIRMKKTINVNIVVVVVEEAALSIVTEVVAVAEAEEVALSLVTDVVAAAEEVAPSLAAEVVAAAEEVDPSLAAQMVARHRIKSKKAKPKKSQRMTDLKFLKRQTTHLTFTI